MLKAIAIDDEPLALKLIGQLVAEVDFVQLESTFTNAFEAIAYLRYHPVDLLFLDIKMPDISGIDFLRGLPERPMVIFTTAYSEFALQGFELDAIDYLLKPFSSKRFVKACMKAGEQHQKQLTSAQANMLMVKSGYEKFNIDLGKLLYVESINNYVRFVLTGQSIVSRLTMKEAARLLPPTAFIRIHRSYIVAKNQLTKIDKNKAWLRDIELPVGAAFRRFMQDL